MCCFISILQSLFVFPLAEISWGNLRLTKAIEISLVLIVNDYFRCAKTNGSSKSNTSSNRSDNLVKVKWASWCCCGENCIMNYYRSKDYGRGGQTTVLGLHPARWPIYSSPPNALHIFSSTTFPTVGSSATQDWLLPVFSWLRTVSSPPVTRQSLIWPSGRNVWPPLDYGINQAEWRRNFLVIA